MFRHKKKLAGRVVVATLIALAGSFITRPGAAAPLEVYGRLPTLENIALSPDGTLIALVQTTKANERVLIVHSLVEHKRVTGLAIGAAKLRSIEWADNNSLMIFSSVTGMPWGLAGPPHECISCASGTSPKEAEFLSRQGQNQRRPYHG